MGYEFEQKDYPLYTQIGTFYSRDEIRKWLSDSTQRLIYCEDYAYFIKDTEFIYTPEISDIINRYQMQENGYVSFSNIYDELPAKWPDIVRIIKNTITEAGKVLMKRESQKNVHK